MRLNASARMQVVSKELKEARLKEFILNDLKAREASEGGAEGARCYRLVARSLDSPVARALASLVPDAAALGIEIQAVFLRLDGVAPASDGVSHFVSPSVTCRKAGDPRLVEAHEQLFLGNGRAWTGDSMRRDPSRRDAYESYCDYCEIIAGWADRSFLRIWASASAFDLGCAVRSATDRVQQAQPDAPLITIAEDPAITIPFLH